MHPMHNEYEIRVEQTNKASLLSSPKFIEDLLDLVVNHVVILDVLQYYFFHRSATPAGWW